jgi:glycosyltransferase involved in cell wall biosynthesis
MEAPFISLVINNYNYAEFLGECIDSCLDQVADVAYEVVVVDDGSTDTSMQVIQAFGSAIKPVYQANGGQAAAFAAGWREASGHVIWFVDSDDRLLPNAVQTVMDAWIPGISFLQAGLRLIDRQGSQIGLLHSNEWLEAGDVWSRILTRANHSFVYSPTSGIAFARDALEKCLPLREDLWRTSADGMLVHLAAAQGPVARMSDVVAEYRLHGANAWAAVQFSANRDQGSEWDRRLRLHDLLRLCGLVELISMRRSDRRDLSFAVDMYERAVQLYRGLETEFWSTSRITKQRVAEALNEATIAIGEAVDKGEGGLQSRLPGLLRGGRSRSLGEGTGSTRSLIAGTTAVLQRAKDLRAGDLQAQRHLPVWDVINSPAVRSSHKWPHGAAWARGFSRHAWNPVETAAYNLAPDMQLRIRVPGSNASMIFLLVGANVGLDSWLRLEVTCNGSRLPVVEFTGLTRVVVPTTGDDCVLLDLSVSVNDGGNWRRADAQET